MHRFATAPMKLSVGQRSSRGAMMTTIKNPPRSTLSHFDEAGASRMVDVGAKPETHRTARASAVVRMQPTTLALIRDKQLAKGDVLEVARLAGIMGAKKTPDLIPLCH